MDNKDFFKEQTISSKIKSLIVSEYFPSYCKIITKKHIPDEVRYIDLFAGPGLYDDRKESTPILVTRKCVDIPLLKEKARLMFNDVDYGNVLKNNYDSLFAVNGLKIYPRFGTKKVGECPEIDDFLMKSTMKHGLNGLRNVSPSMLFIDPFGYKGVNTTVLTKFMKNWGNEIFLFVNIKRIHAAIENEKFESLMRELFPTTFDEVKNDRRYKLNPQERISLIVDKLGLEFEKELGAPFYYTSFQFQEEDNKAASHYIMHFTKHHRGFDLVKTIYNDFANVGTVFDGVNSYTFDPKKNNELELIDFNQMNIEKLAQEILEKYKSKTTTAYDIFERENAEGSLYSRSHYTHALRELVKSGDLSAVFTDNKNHRESVLPIKECILKFN